MELLGALMVASCGLVWGMLRSGELKQRVEALAELQRFFQYLRAEIRYSATPLPELLAKGQGGFCQEAREDHALGEDPLGALERAGRKILKNPEDRELFRRFSRELGTTGAQEQVEHIALYAALLESQLSQAQEEYKEKRRLYPALGLFAGIALCIVIL